MLGCDNMYISIDHLREGMVVDEPVFLGNAVLIPAGKVLTSDIIDRVKNHRDKIINDKLKATASLKGIKLLEGDVMTCDVFDPYVDWKAINARIPKNLDIVATEMESFALFYIAKVLHKEAACLLTVVDSKCTTELISSEDREKSLTNMIEVALDTIY